MKVLVLYLISCAGTYLDRIEFIGFIIIFNTLQIVLLLM